MGKFPIVKDIEESDYDLVVIGGLGAVKDSVLGSVCERIYERITRRVQTDTLIVKNRVPIEESFHANGPSSRSKSYGSARSLTPRGALPISATRW